MSGIGNTVSSGVRLTRTDLVLSLLALAAATFLARLAWPVTGTRVVTVGLVLIGVAITTLIMALAAVARRNRGVAITWLARAYMLGLVLLALHRWYGWDRADDEWPPRRRSPDVAMAQISDSSAAKWAALVVAAAAHLGGARSPAPEVPAAWRLPPAVEIGIDSASAGAPAVWARRGTALACVPVAPVVSAQSGTACRDTTVVIRRIVFASPRRTGVPAGVPTNWRGTAWPQYRRDSERSAALTVPSPDDTTAWRASVSGQVRSSPSGTANLVFVGGHGRSLLTALDAQSGVVRWQVNTFNWIHQDPVTDGQRVIVGFGDSEESFEGTAPGGVAAHDAATGRLLWAQFDESSVMTSAVLVDSSVIYATAAGVLRRRSLGDGALLDSLLLPGGAIMAPLVHANGHVIATLDRNGVCAIVVPTFSVAWCRHLNHLRLLGHSAASVQRDVVILSGISTPLGLPVPALWSGHSHLVRRWLPHVLGYVGAPEQIMGQMLVALDLATGRALWSSQSFAANSAVHGHNSGTPTLGDELGVVVLPNADTLVAFSAANGRVRWTAGARGARGPVLLARGLVVTTGGDGTLETRLLQTGELRCRIRIGGGTDRAGPLDLGGKVVFADRDGTVHAVPWSHLLACRDDRPASLGRGPS